MGWAVYTMSCVKVIYKTYQNIIFYSFLHSPNYGGFVLGEADYCLSPSDELSTYSKTAIARSYCKYIDYQEGKHCDVSKATTNTEFLLRTTTTDEDYNFDIPTQLTSDEVFDSVEKSFVENMEACVDTDGKEVIEEYWEKQISFHEHENGNRHF